MTTLQRIYKICNELVEAKKHPDSDFTVNTTAAFAKKARYYNIMLAEPDVVTKSLQIRGRPLSDCRSDIATLLTTFLEKCKKVTCHCMLVIWERNTCP